jgi:hypothetical protein
VKLRQFEENVFELHPEPLHAAMGAIADKSHGAFSAEQLKGAIQNNSHAGFFYCTDDLDIRGIIIVTKVLYADGNAVLVIVGAAGDSMGEWLDANDLLAELAGMMKCKGVEIKGRRGLVKKFKQLGWTEQYASLYRDVPPVEQGAD